MTNEKMGKLKPIEQFHKNFRKGNLVRIVLREKESNNQLYEKTGYIKEINTGSERRHPINIVLSSSSEITPPFFKISYFPNAKKSNPHIKGYEVLRRAKKK